MGGKKIIVKPEKKLAFTESALIDRIPPQNTEAEMAVLGSMLLEEDAIADVVEILDRDSFYKENHRVIFTAMVNLFSENKPADLITLTEQLRKENNLEQAGGAGYLSELANIVPTAANVLHHAKIAVSSSLNVSLKI